MVRFVVVMVAMLAAGLSAQPGPSGMPAPPPPRDGRHDFEFLQGSWFGRHTRLDRPLSGTRYMNRPPGFVGHMVVRPLAGGPSSIVEYELILRDSSRVHGATLFVYDTATHSWTLQTTNVDTGRPEPPLTGHFAKIERGQLEGEFFGTREFGGRMVLVRQTWRLIGPNLARWVQAFSADGGKNWEDNWWVEYTRIRDAGPGASALAEDVARDTSLHRESAHSVETLRQVRQFRVVNGEELPATYCCYALEMRRYIVPEKSRDALVDLFERENDFARSRMGTSSTLHTISWMENIALFRDLDRPDSYIWLRGFFDGFGEGVKAFHYGSLWNSHLETLARADITLGDAHLLDPGYLTGGFVLGDPPDRPVDPKAKELIVATIYTLKPELSIDFESLFNYDLLPHIYDAGARPVARFKTSLAMPNVPGLAQIFKPMLVTDSKVYVWFARFPNVEAYERYAKNLEQDQQWKSDVLRRVEPLFATPPQVLRLVPVGRSRRIF